MRYCRYFQVIAIAFLTILALPGYANAGELKWQEVPLTSKFQSTAVVSSAAASAIDPHTLIAQTNYDTVIFHDADRNHTPDRKTLSLPAQPAGFTFDPVYPHVVYAATNRGIFRHDLGTNHWASFGETGYNNWHIISMAVSRGHIYAIARNDMHKDARVYRFDRDGGHTLLPLQGDWPFALAVEFDDQNLYVMTRTALHRSRDQGATWQHVTDYDAGAPRVSTLHAADGQVWALSSREVLVLNPGGHGWTALMRRHELPGDSLKQSANQPFKGLVLAQDKIYTSLGPHVLSASSSGRGRVDHTTSPGGSITSLAAGPDSLIVGTDKGLSKVTGVFADKPTIQRPLVLVPGIMGSWEAKGKWHMDPILGTYDVLIAQLKDAGYVSGKNLFVFPYNWRQPNAESARQLTAKIESIKAACACPKVDLVAHSMGGLVSRSYIQSDGYRDDVANLIQLGTPNNGSAAALPMWEGGQFAADGAWGKLTAEVMRAAFLAEAAHNGIWNLRDYTQQKITSVRELLPTSNYIQGRNYPTGYTANPFLEQLNHPDQVAKLKQRTNLHIIGSQSLGSTWKKFDLTHPGDTGWANGKPVGIERGPGDGTVLNESLTAIGPKSLDLQDDHGGINDRVSAQAIQLLTGTYHAPKPARRRTPTTRLLQVLVFSPVRITIVDAQGRTLDHDSTEIPGSFITGHDSPAHFATVREPQDDYRIILDGTGNGSYRLEVTQINANAAANETHTFSGYTVEGARQEFKFDSAANKVTDKRDSTDFLFTGRVDNLPPDVQKARDVLESTPPAQAAEAPDSVFKSAVPVRRTAQTSNSGSVFALAAFLATSGGVVYVVRKYPLPPAARFS